CAPPPAGGPIDAAVRLAKLLAVLMPDDAETLGLLSLMLLQDSRRAARLDAQRDIALLDEQDRWLWDARRIEEGRRVLDRALRLRRPGPYQLQAAIASLHPQDEPDWPQIVERYVR